MSNLIQCPACGRQVSKNAAACPSCAEPIKPERTNTAGINLRDPVHVAGVSLAVLIVLASALYVFSVIADSRRSERFAIEKIKTDNLLIGVNRTLKDR